VVIFNNYSLKNLNTFAINAKAKYFVSINQPEDILELIETDIFVENRHFVLGGGSNVLFQSDFDGLIIHIENKGIEIIGEDANFVYVRASAGEIWDNLVAFCVDSGFGGTENLSLIPGTVGASPVQNIGAYGVEVKDIIEEVKIFNFYSSKIEVLSNFDCEFEYRNSIFKNELKNNAIVLNVIFKLTKNPKLNLNYSELNFRMKHFMDPSILDVRNTVITIRNEKLPNPAIIPNAGSFFKNPVISVELFNKLQNDFSGLKGFLTAEGKIKLAAGQLIELCGWKFKQGGKVAVHPNQALVIINKNNASGEEIIEFASIVRDSVFEKFGVLIESEVNII